MSFCNSSSVYPTASLAAILAIGNPVAFDASALDRLTRGFISITIIRPSAGLTANWMFDPPVSTPISRMMAFAASRIRWYSLSVRVWIGATVIESPVWTPIGSRFSMPQTMMTLSATSRTTSSSYSFQPITDSSTSTSPTGLSSSPRLMSARNSSRLYAMPPPVPPMVKLGRSTHGRPTSSTIRSASAIDRATPLLGTAMPILTTASLNFCRSSALSITSCRAPIISTPYFVQHAVLVQVHRRVERGLAAERRQEGVRAFLGDDLLDHLPGDRLDVRPVGHARVGHDRGRVAVHEDDGVPLLAEGLARLGAGVVELARLADHDRAGPDEQDLFQVGALRHGGRSPGVTGAAGQGGGKSRSAYGRPAGRPPGPAARRLSGRPGLTPFRP